MNYSLNWPYFNSFNCKLTTVATKKMCTFFWKVKIAQKIILEIVRNNKSDYILKSWKSLFFDISKNKYNRKITLNSVSSESTVPNPTKFSILKVPPWNRVRCRFQVWGVSIRKFLPFSVIQSLKFNNKTSNYSKLITNLYIKILLTVIKRPLRNLRCLPLWNLRYKGFLAGV